MFRKGQSVIINDPNESYHGQSGVIIATDPRGSFPYQVRMVDGDYWFTAEEVSAPSTPDDENPHDFSRTGLGIGGLGYHVEEPTIPTVKQIERLEQMERKARRCRRCGCTDVFDGAMFTTDPSSGLCDDCYG